MTVLGDTDAEIARLLQEFIAAQTGGLVPQLVGLARVSAGRSRENWCFDAIWSADGNGIPEPLIVRRDPNGGLVETDRATEFAILSALEPTTLPTPHVRWLDASGRWLGRPALIMRREHGDCDYHVLNGSLPLPARLALAKRFCSLLAEVHLLRWEALDLGEILTDPGAEAARIELDRFLTILRNDELRTYPEIEASIPWLQEHAPTPARTVLVHGDFKPGNALVVDDQVSALLDWELAHLGDPLEDLGWVTQPLREREHFIPGSWEREQLVDSYVAQTGFDVPADALHWWQTFATFRTAVMQVSGLRAYVDGRSDEAYRPTQRVLKTLIKQTHRCEIST